MLPPAVSPRAAFADLRAFLRQRSREQVLGLIMSLLVTTIILIIFTVDAKVNTAPPPTIVYVENYAPDRTDADIIAQQKIDAEAKRAAAEKRRQEYQALEKQLGM